jgi:hypothetical protein
VQYLVLPWLLQGLADPDVSREQLLGIAALMFAIVAVRILVENHYFWIMFRVGSQVRTRTHLRVSCTSRSSHRHHHLIRSPSSSFSRPLRRSPLTPVSCVDSWCSWAA